MSLVRLLVRGSALMVITLVAVNWPPAETWALGVILLMVAVVCFEEASRG